MRIACLRPVFVLLGLLGGGLLWLSQLDAAEYRFVARLAEDEPIWAPSSTVISLSGQDDETILVLENPTDVVHGFVVPGLSAITGERRLTPAANPYVVDETSLYYTGPVSVTVPPGSTRRLRISDNGMRAKKFYRETFAVLCPVHKATKAGALEIVKW